MSADGIYTRCPACAASYELRIHELAEAAGVVRCSNCGKTFNSLASLFDQRPEEDLEPLQGGGMPPLLGHRIFLQHEIPGLDDASGPGSERVEPQGDENPASDQSALPATRPRSGPWIAAAALLALALAAQLVWLIDLPTQWLQAEVADKVAPQEAIAVVARDLHPHPSLTDAVIISATLRNRSAAGIALPIVELRLYDSTNQVLGVRRFEPVEYLPPIRRGDRHLEPGRELPIILEVMAIGSQPAGFEFQYFSGS